MIAITCAAKNGAMLFNNRRCSKDKAVIKDIIKHFNNIKITAFSKDLFSEADVLTIASTEELTEHDVFFFEDIPFNSFSKHTDTLIVYRWDRIYPKSSGLEIDQNFKLVSSEQFEGNSHSVIFKEIYKDEKKK